MKITIEAEPKEIAALALAIQGQPVNTINVTATNAERKEFADWLEDELAKRLESRLSSLQT